MTRLAHESRNALQRAQASLDLLAEELGGDPRIRELLDSIGRAMDDLHRLYEEVRAFAAPICVRPEIVDIRDILRNAWSELASVCKDRTVCVRERATCDDLRCEVDPFGVGQVFRNIFDNALNACSDPVEISIEFADACEQGSPALSIRIRDNGPGLSPHEQQHVFDSFFTTKAEGTGLGMAIAYRIVDAHHGTIAVDPDCMNGAEFVVTLPRKQP
jgi:signal transduction histidine kinase